MAAEQEDITTQPSPLESLLQALDPLRTIRPLSRTVLQLLAEDFSPHQRLKTVVELDPILTAALLSDGAGHTPAPHTIAQA